MYREARRQIASRDNSAPKTIKEIDFSEFFKVDSDPDKVAYFPVFEDTCGWWGQLLGTNAKVRDKIIVSPECQLYEIGRSAAAPRHKLFAAEVPGRFFCKLRGAASQIKDAIATDSGTIMTLVVGSGESRIKNCVHENGGLYYGPLGGY